MNQPQVQVLYDADTIRNKVADLGRQLQSDLAGEDPVLVSILGGSVVFLADLLRAIEMPIRYETVKVRYSHPAANDSALEIDFPIALDVEDQTVVLLKDVVATGVTEGYLTSQFLGLGAKQVLVVAFIDLPEQRNSEISVDYQLFTPRKPGTFVGYGMKQDGRYGNLPYLGRIVTG